MKVFKTIAVPDGSEKFGFTMTMSREINSGLPIEELRSYLSLVRLFGKYYVYFRRGKKQMFWKLFCSVYLHKTEEPVDPLEAPILFRERMDMYCGKKSLYLL